MTPTNQQTAGETLRCTICGFVIDTRYKAEKPTADFTTQGRGNRRDAEIARLRAEAEDMIDRKCVIGLFAEINSLRAERVELIEIADKLVGYPQGLLKNLTAASNDETVKRVQQDVSDAHALLARLRK